MQKMNNKKGVKLLAAIMVFAMAFAGLVVLTTSDDSAATVNQIDAEEAPQTIGGITESTKYVVTSDKVITLGASTENVTLYVANGVTVTLTGTVFGGNVIIKAADSSAKNCISDDSTITISAMGDTSDNKSFTIKASYSGSETVGSVLTITGNTTATFAISGTYNDVTVGSNGLTTAVTNTGFKYGSQFKASNVAEIADYTAVGTNKTFSSIADGNIISVKNGTYTISNGDNSIKFNKYKGDATITGTDSGATSITATGSSDKGTISIVKGTFTGSITSKAFSGVKVGSSEYTNQVPSKLGDGDSATTYTILGTFELKNNVNDVAKISISVGAGATLIIPESNTVVVDDFSYNTGSITKVFGSLSATSEDTTGGSVYTGVFGEVTGVTITGNSNVATGDDRGLSGDVSGEIKDAILVGNAVVPSGQTLTVTGYLGLNKNNLKVEGTLIIVSSAALYTALGTEEISLGTSGKIVIDGSFGTMKNVIVTDVKTTPNKITISGISGVQFGYATLYDGSKVISISGEIKTSGFIKNEDGSEIGSIIMANKAAISGDLTVGSGVTITGVSTTEIVENSNVTIDGEFAVGAILDYGASLDINGKLLKDAVITVKTGSVDGAGKVSGTTVFTVTVDDATGFTIYSKNVKNEDGQQIRAYLNGTIEDITINYVPATPGPGVEEAYPNLAITSGEVYIDDVGFTVGDNTTLTATKAILEGTITIGPKAGATTAISDYIGATYSVKDTDSKVTVYYTTLAVALENIESAQNKKITAQVDDVEDVITVSAGQTLVITINGDVKKGASIVAEKDSKVTINADAESKLIGSIVVYKGVSCTPDFSKIDATIVSEDKTTYAGFVTAVDMASAGDTLAVGDVESDESLIIKDGITLVADSLTVKGNLTVPETSTLKAGSITMTAPAANVKAKVNVAGTLDLSAGSITGDYELKSTGKTIVASIDANKMSGAYYTTSEGLVLTTVENAVKDATDGEVVIIGKISEKTDMTLSGVDLRVSGSDVTLGIITLENAKVIAEGKLTATIVSKAATATTGAADASVSIVGATITVQDIETGLQINNVAGKVNILSGTVAIAGVATVAADSELTVAKDSQALVSGSLTANNGKITVDGELAVKGTFTSAITSTINGTFTAMAGSTVSMKAAKISGSIIAEETSSFAIEDSDVVVLNGGKIVGEFALTSTEYIKAFAGADVSAMDLGATVYSTAFYVNGDLIETIYAIDGAVIPDISGDLKKIPELNVPTTTTWKDADGAQVDIGTATIDDVSAIYANIALQTAKVKVSVGSGLSLWIDGVKQVTAETVDLTIGEHQVQVTVNPGYKGTATITFNGQTISNGKIDITSDMVGATNVISATGDITIDTGDTPAPVEKDDSGMGITDYLLIVLVVLAAILVVIVAIRMMRS